MKKEDYFSVRHSEVKRTTTMIRWFARIWILFCMLVGLAILGGIAYVIINPELIGQFAGEVVSGFESEAG